MNKYKSYEEIKILNGSGISKAMHHNGSHLLLFGKKSSKVLKFHVNNFSHFEISAPSLKRHTLKLQNQISAGGTYDTIFEIPSAENIFEKSAVILTT